MKQTTKLITLEKIIEPAHIIREQISDEKIIELAESMKEIGQLQAILVRQVDDKYEIIAGHRRYLAMKMLGWKTIEAKITVADNNTTILQRVHENLYRDDITNVDEANIVAYLHYECKWELPQISSKLRKSQRWIADRIDIYHMPDEIKNALREKKIPTSVALELMKIDEPEKRIYFLENAILHGATQRQVMGWRIDFAKESFVPVTGVEFTPPDLSLTTKKQIDVNCFVCDIGMNVLDTMTTNVCKHCWSEIYRQKTQNKMNPPVTS